MELSELKYISDKRAKEFNKLNIFSVEQLVTHYPRAFLDLTRQESVTDLYHNQIALIKCEILSIEVNKYSKRPYVKAICQQGENIFPTLWFNQMYVATKLKRGEYLFYGRVQNKFGMGVTMVNPTFEEADDNYSLKGVIPVYSLKGTLTQKVVRFAIRDALKKIQLTDAIPYPLLTKYGLMPINDAYRLLHQPSSLDDVERASSRIALEEYFLLISAFSVIKGDNKTSRTVDYTTTEKQVASFIARFPFSLTDGQRVAIREIYNNLHSPIKMNRLLQGDVGSGKTAVALTAIYMAVQSGFQAVMLAPTEVLAQQNYHILQTYFPEYNVASLTGSTPTAEKKAIKSGLKNGDISIVCGTHAVIQKDVQFKNLTLVICDEQHRFGVAQRSSLSNKGDSVDVLIMSATPIPRTLSLIFYGDLDISVIKDKPAKRKEISTGIVPPHKYNDMLSYIQRECVSGKQCYIVAPKIEGEEEDDIYSVTELYNELKDTLTRCKIALLHGKMKDAEKNQVMTDFKNHKYDILVSTTVIEVGVDVPNATIMVIYNAERFGLSQLHQLRGRVGRGDVQSYCFLLMGKESDEGKQRLQIIESNTDGFKIAEADLQMRGGGDFFGTRQSGKVLSEIKNLKFPISTIYLAKDIVDEAFSGRYNTAILRELAKEKYDKLKDIVLN